MFDLQNSICYRRYIDNGGELVKINITRDDEFVSTVEKNAEHGPGLGRFNWIFDRFIHSIVQVMGPLATQWKRIQSRDECDESRRICLLLRQSPKWMEIWGPSLGISMKWFNEFFRFIILKSFYVSALWLIALSYHTIFNWPIKKTQTKQHLLDLI